MLIVGDFNAPSLFYTNPTPGTFNAEFLDIIQVYPLYNHTKAPTRFRLPDVPSLLDLILTNDELMVENVEYHPPLGRSDHAVLTFRFVCYANKSDTHTSMRSRTDYVKLRQLASSIDWKFLSTCDPIQAWDRLENSLRSLINTTTEVKPIRNTKFSSSRIRSRTRKWIALRNTAWFLYQNEQSSVRWEEYRKLRNHCTSLIRADRLEAQKALIEKCVANPKHLYRHINTIRRVKPGIPPLTSPEGLTNTPREAAEELLHQYISVTKPHPQEVTTDFLFFPEESDNIAECLTSINFTADKVRQLLINLKPHSSPGCDNFQPKLFVELADVLAEPLAAFFQNLFDRGCVPQCWKLGTVTPIYKGGDRADPANYRPVTLLPVLSKVMEAVIAEQLLHHLEQHGHLSLSQHGFRPGRSCTTNLLLAQSHWTSSADSGLGVDVIYLDLSKAFDRVRHDILIKKLLSYNVQGNCLRWIYNFLQQRKIAVRVHGELSHWEHEPCGVPQGSVLGPRLFLVYIIDITTEVTSNILLFADDAKIWRSIYSPTDCESLQNDLDKVYKWSVTNQLPFNTQKCHVLSIHKQTNFDYKLNGIPLLRKSEERDLGIIVQHNLGWTSNSQKASRNAFKQLGLLRRVFGSFVPHLFSRLVSIYLRPQIEYAAQVCRPWLKRDKLLLEHPLRKATKHVRGYWNLPYSERLRSLGVYSVAYRLLRGDLILSYKILNNDNHPCRSLLMKSTSTNLRGHPLKLSHQHSHLNCRRFFFSLRICRIWNSLPEEVVMAPSLNLFKKRLDELMGDHRFNFPDNFSGTTNMDSITLQLH